MAEAALPQPELQRVHVAYALDANNLAGLLGSMTSLSQHLAEPKACTIHVIVAKENMDLAQRLLECFRDDAAVLLPEVVLHELMPHSFSIGTNNIQGRLAGNSALFAKVELDKYVDAPRVVWLDTDTVVQSDIAELYRMRMKHALAAALEISSMTLKHLTLAQWYHRFYKEFAAFMGPDSKLDGNWPIFNSGVMLLDLDKWRRESITKRYAELIDQLHMGNDDQMMLNFLLPGPFRKFDVLEGVWNLGNLGCPPGGECADATAVWNATTLSAAKLLHWSGPDKYWKGKHRFNYLVEKYIPHETCDVLGKGGFTFV